MARHTAPQSENANKQLSRRILVTIKRDMTEVTPRVIWQHEKPLLEEMFSEGAIVEVSAATLDEGYSPKARADMLIHNKTMETVARPSDSMGLGFVFIGNPEVEYQRLTESFGRHPEENVPMVEKIYGRLQTGNFKRLVGAPALHDLPLPQLRTLVLDYGYAPMAHKDATAEEKQAANKQRQELAAMEINGLVEVAESMGIEIG